MAVKRSRIRFKTFFGKIGVLKAVGLHPTAGLPTKGGYPRQGVVTVWPEKEIPYEKIMLGMGRLGTGMINATDTTRGTDWSAN